MIIFIGLLLAFIFIVLPVMLGCDMYFRNKINLKRFRENLQPKQQVKIQINNSIRLARIKKATKSLVYVTLATGFDICVPIEDVYPLNYFQDDDTSFEVNNIKVA